MSVNFSPCVLIPCYNHGAMMPGVLARLKPFNLPCIVVDDGSDAATQQQLDNLVSEQ
ncbi:glycosyltransferase, partial [Escherichia coli]|nr:glycosyltransferase [Escherichia coli]MBB8010786.1 glycosyltransferase [Escherichia coli]